MKIACLILATGNRYKVMAQCAYNSFKKWHPEVDTILITDENAKDYVSQEALELYSVGVAKYSFALELMLRFQYDKVICLGADTITCARLDEFIDNNSDDIVCTLDTPIQYKATFEYLTEEDCEEYDQSKSVPVKNLPRKAIYEPVYSPMMWWTTPGDDTGAHNRHQANRGQPFLKFTNAGTPEYYEFVKQGYEPIEHMYLNADVVCFNNYEIIRDILQLYEIGSQDPIFKYHFDMYHEQGALNFFIWGMYFAKTNKYTQQQNPLVQHIKKLMYDRAQRIAQSGGVSHEYKVGFPEVPYAFSNVVYNVRAKTCTLTPNITKTETGIDWSSHIQKYYIQKTNLTDSILNQFLTGTAKENSITKEPKLYVKFYPTPKDMEDDNNVYPDKQIKVFHYCEGFGNLDDEQYEMRVNMWINDFFNDETKQFFKEHCDCGDFFEKQFKLEK